MPRTLNFLVWLCLFLWVPMTGLVAGEINEIDGVAIKGYDPVAYFSEQRPVLGSAEFTAEYKNTVFQFVSAENRDRFLADPAAYAPQYGGYCAYGTSKGYKADIEPEAFTITDGKLYLNYNLDVRSTWTADMQGYIAKADANWPDVAQTSEIYR